MRSGPGNLASTNGVFYNVTVLTRHPKNNGTPEEPGRGALGRPDPRRGWSGKRKIGPASVNNDDAAEVAKRSGATARASAPAQGRVVAGPSNRPSAPGAAGPAHARGSATEPIRARASSADQARTAIRAKAGPSASGVRNGARPVQSRASVGRAGDPQVRGPVAPPRRPWRRQPRYVYRLADLDELFATAAARTDAEAEKRRDRSNWRVIGVVMLVAAGLAIATAGLVNEAVTFVMNIFAA